MPAHLQRLSRPTSAPVAIALGDAISLTLRSPCHDVLSLHLALRCAGSAPEVRLLEAAPAGRPSTLLLRGSRHDIDAAMQVIMRALPRAEFGAIHPLTAVVR